ncbi:MAG: hypothetical protein K6B75_05430 [Lachnospiraceae bacterium]|nr:hypothetical protein [Lachnospiraceae bacterium]
MVFFSELLKSAIEFVIIAAAAVGSCMLGAHLRKKKDAKKAEQEKTGEN